MPDVSPRSPLLTSDVARRLGVSNSSVHLYVRTGQLPAVRTVGGTHIFDPDDVDHFDQLRRAGTKREPAVA